MGKMVKNMGTYGTTMGKMVEKWEHMGEHSENNNGKHGDLR